MRFMYPAIFSPEEEGGFSISFPDIPDCFTCGEDLEDGARMAAEALELALEIYLDEGLPVPAATFDRVFPGNTLLMGISVDVAEEGRLISTTEAARLLGVGASRVRQLVGAGQLPSVKRGRDTLVYLEAVRRRVATAPKAGRPKKSVTVAGCAAS